jgi:hypothetical protein
MPIPSFRKAFALLLAGLALFLAAPAYAAVTATLRVEGPGLTLDPGHHYRTGTERVDRGTRSGCEANGHTAVVQGATALGIVQSALDDGRKSLSPFRVQTFSSTPGYFTCRIGDYSSDPGYWLYRVDHVSPEVGADQYALKAGDEVLWYYADFGSGVNTGDELALRAPASATSGQPFTVRVIAFDATGKRSPVEGATVSGGDVPVLTGSDGRAQVTVSGSGRAALTATHGSDIPSERERVSVS